MMLRSHVGIAAAVAISAVVVWRLKTLADAPGPESQALKELKRLRQEELPTPQDLQVRVVSESPRIYVLENFLSEEECEFLKQLVNGRLEPAKVVEKAENKYDLQVTTRNNKQIWLTRKEERSTPLLRHIIKRMHRAARVPDDDAEALQIGKYGIDEKYELHLDSDPGHDVPRPATLIAYLNDVEAGGETLFPMNPRNRLACATKWHDFDGGKRFGIKNCCDLDQPGIVKIPPRRGRAVLFWNHHVIGDRDRSSEHAACPVKAGEKWIVQRWFRFEPYQKIVHPPDVRFDGVPRVTQAKASGVDMFSVKAGFFDARPLSQKRPQVYLIEDFLSPQECQHLIDLALTLPISEENPGSIARRWIQPEKEVSDLAVAAVAKRMHRAAMVPEAFGEILQFGRYEPGGRLNFHLDSAPKHGILRPFSMIVYLDGDGSSQAGGATVFPLGKCTELLQCCDFAEKDASDGPLIIPRKVGRAVLFFNHHLDGKLAEEAVHASCPAGDQGKWIVQRWFRTSPFSNLKYHRDPQFDYPKILSE